MPIAKDGPATGAGFALRLRPSTFGIFDEFPDDAGRNAHRSGQVAKTLTLEAVAVRKTSGDRET
jgi:hypothetical protein